MPYGTLKVDNIIFTNSGVDQTITVSGIVASTSGNLTVTGTVSGDVIRGGTTVSGATVTGAVGQFGNLTAVSGVFTTQVSGATVTGNVGQFTSVTGGTAGFTTVTGTTVTGTTANFVTVSGTTVTGTTANFTSGNFTSISGGTHTITSGVFATGSVTNPSISFASDPNTGIYSPGADQVAISTNGTGRLFVDANGNVEIKAQGDLRFADSDGSNWVAFQAPATVASNVTWTLPAADGFNGQALTTNGSSTLAWATVGDVTLTGTQTLTNKTLTDPSITGTILEDVFTITDGAAFEIDPGNGSVQLITLGASRTPKATNFAAGEAVTLMVDDGSAYTLTWTDATWGGSGVVWKTDSGSAPTLNTTGYTAIILWKVSTQVYGARVGDA
jgi:hypothetical protein